MNWRTCWINNLSRPQGRHFKIDGVLNMKALYVLYQLTPNGDKQLGKEFTDATQAQAKADELNEIAKENEFNRFFGVHLVTVEWGVLLD
jgi:hypothetical protein